jgi:hypothetical protein
MKFNKKFTLILVTLILNFLVACQISPIERTSGNRMLCQSRLGMGEERVRKIPSGVYTPIGHPYQGAYFVSVDQEERQAIVVANKFGAGDVVVHRKYEQFLWFSRLSGAKMRVLLEANYPLDSFNELQRYLQENHGIETINKAWMAETRLLPVSPWISDRAFVEPCLGHYLDTVSFEFLLDASEVREIEKLDEGFLVLSGTVFYFEKGVKSYFHSSFTVRKQNIQFE